MASNSFTCTLRRVPEITKESVSVTKGCATVAESVICCYCSVHTCMCGTLSLWVVLKSKLCTSIMPRDSSGTRLRNPLKNLLFDLIHAVLVVFSSKSTFFQNDNFFSTFRHYNCCQIINVLLFFSRQALLIFIKERSSKTGTSDKNLLFPKHFHQE